VWGWLLDAIVILELRKQRPSARVRGFVKGLRLQHVFISSVTLAEIRCGVEVVGDPSCRAELTDWLLHKARPLFDQRVLQVLEDVMCKWRLFVEEGRKAGHTFSQPHLISAATALQHGLTVVTRDPDDFKLARVPPLNPWVDKGR
jgi:toxin FitB